MRAKSSSTARAVPCLLTIFRSSPSHQAPILESRSIRLARPSRQAYEKVVQRDDAASCDRQPQEQGEILERGTHESLYALHGRYYDLYTRQHGLEANLFLAPGEGDKVEEPDTAKI